MYDTQTEEGLQGSGLSSFSTGCFSCIAVVRSRLSSIRVKVSGRKPHGSSTVPWKAEGRPCVLFLPPARPCLGFKKGQILLSLVAVNGAHLHHCCGLDAADSRRSPRFLSAREFICYWCFQTWSNGAQLSPCTRVPFLWRSAVAGPLVGLESQPIESGCQDPTTWRYFGSGGGEQGGQTRKRT